MCQAVNRYLGNWGTESFVLWAWFVCGSGWFGWSGGSGWFGASGWSGWFHWFGCSSSVAGMVGWLVFGVWFREAFPESLFGDVQVFLDICLLNLETCCLARWSVHLFGALRGPGS